MRNVLPSYRLLDTVTATDTRLLNELDEFPAARLRDIAQAAVRIAYLANGMATEKERPALDRNPAESTE